MTVFSKFLNFFLPQFIQIIYKFSQLALIFYIKLSLTHTSLISSYNLPNKSEQSRPIDYGSGARRTSILSTILQVYNGAQEDRQKNNNARHQSPQSTTTRSSRTSLGEIQPRVVGYLILEF